MHFLEAFCDTASLPCLFAWKPSGDLAHSQAAFNRCGHGGIGGQTRNAVVREGAISFRAAAFWRLWRDAFEVPMGRVRCRGNRCFGERSLAVVARRNSVDELAREDAAEKVLAAI